MMFHAIRSINGTSINDRRWEDSREAARVKQMRSDYRTLRLIGHPGNSRARLVKANKRLRKEGKRKLALIGAFIAMCLIGLYLTQSGILGTTIHW